MNRSLIENSCLELKNNMDLNFPKYEEFHTKVVFYRIPKNAGTSICDHLSHVNLLNFHKRDLREKFKNPTYIKPDEFKNSLVGDNLRNYFSFCVVRNPWDRVVSAYFSGSKDNSFSDFCKKGAKNYFGIGKQIDWTVGKYPPSQILHFENLRYEFSEMIKKHRILNVYFDLPCKNKTEHKHYSEYYDSETESIVADVFKEDIDLFNYSFKQEIIVEDCNNNIII